MPTVTQDNFIRAETDTYFAGFVRDGGFGRLVHDRDLADIAHQTVVRMNATHSIRMGCSTWTQGR